LYACRRIGT